MTVIFDIALWLAATVLAVPLFVLLVECLAALLPERRTRHAPRVRRPPCAVLIPAHDEEAGIAATLATVQPQLGAADRLIVVADNCTDRTAAIARSLGATVVERHDCERRGKGFALDCGVGFLAANPPEVLIVIDADCAAEVGAIDHLARGVGASGQPRQGASLVTTVPGRAGARAELACFAFLVKNLVRPRGLARLGLPCLLTGTGMALPWSAICDARLASANIVEDMVLAVDLARAGRLAQFCPEARVVSALPESAEAAMAQRFRWEHGHVQTIIQQLPRLLWTGLAEGRPHLIALALELSVPPLSLLSLTCSLVLAAAIAHGTWSGSWGPALMLAVWAGTAGAVFFACWLKFGRGHSRFRSLLAAPVYVLWKVPLYLALAYRPQKKWVRAERPVVPHRHLPQGTLSGD
jgi:cellulose synthase/poly-beta-1,6-N-acetylglucosamine synthase-like glycosyltransferase